MKKRILGFLLLAALLVGLGSAQAAGIRYCSTAMQNTSGVCLNNGSQPLLYQAGVFTVPFSFDIANTTGAVGFAINDTLDLFQMPGGANQCDLLDIMWDQPALDTGSGITLKLGDLTTADKYITTASTLGQASYDDGIRQANAFVAQSLPAAYTANSTIRMTFTHANTTPVTSGVVKGYGVIYCGANPKIGG